MDRGSEFYNGSMNSWLRDIGIEIYSTDNKGKFFVAQRYIRTLKSKICKHTPAISKNVCNDKLDEIVNKYNNTYHRIIKVKPVDIKQVMYTEYGAEHNNKYLKLKVGDRVRIPKYENSFAKNYTAICSEEVFMINEIKHTVP